MKPIIFVSSTSDLEPERAALARDLQGTYQPYMYEEDRARGRPPEEHCRRMIERADVFVGILGPRRGSTYDDERSIVEWEFDVARDQGRIPVMAFLKVDPEDPGVEPAQREFLRRLADFKRGLWCLRFDGPRDLARKVRASIEKWMAALVVGLRASQRRMDRSLNVILGAAIVAAVAGCVWLGLPVSEGAVSSGARIALLGVAAFVILACFFLLSRPRDPGSDG